MKVPPSSIHSIASQGSKYPQTSLPEYKQPTFGVYGSAVVMLLIAFFLSIPSTASVVQLTGSVKIAWDPNPEFDVVGYKIYYGLKSGAYTQAIDVGAATACEIPGLVRENSYFCSVTAYNSYGMYSDFAQELVIPGVIPPIVEENFRVSRMTFGANHLVTFDVSGMSGSVVEVWASSDLANWTLINTFINVSGPITVQDPASAGQPRRFYKLRTP